MTWTAPRTWVTGEVVTSTIMNTHVRDNLIAILPVGSYLYRAAVATSVETTVEGRWIEANGVAVSRVTYSALNSYFAGLTPTYPFGAGNGTSTFNLPDMRGRVAVNMNPGGPATIDALGDNDAVAQALRNVSHVHLQLPGSGGGAGSGINNYDSQTSQFQDFGTPATSGDTNNQDRPAFLVGGCWYIKYTS